MNNDTDLILVYERSPNEILLIDFNTHRLHFGDCPGSQMKLRNNLYIELSGYDESNEKDQRILEIGYRLVGYLEYDTEEEGDALRTIQHKDSYDEYDTDLLERIAAEFQELKESENV